MDDNFNTLPFDLHFLFLSSQVSQEIEQEVERLKAHFFLSSLFLFLSLRLNEVILFRNESLSEFK